MARRMVVSAASLSANFANIIDFLFFAVVFAGTFNREGSKGILRATAKVCRFGDYLTKNKSHPFLVG